MAAVPDDYTRRVIPVTVRQDSIAEKPFVVAFERGAGHAAGDRVTRDAFDDILDDYDAVIVHRRAGDHPSAAHRFLLYGEATQALDADPQIRTVEKRTRSHEITGKFRWFAHGRDLAVDTTIGLHCLSEDIWDGLP